MKRKSKRKEIEFNADLLLARVEGVAADKETVSEHGIKLPSPVKPISEVCQKVGPVKQENIYDRLQF